PGAWHSADAPCVPLLSCRRTARPPHCRDTRPYGSYYSGARVLPAGADRPYTHIDYPDPSGAVALSWDVVASAAFATTSAPRWHQPGSASPSPPLCANTDPTTRQDTPTLRASTRT